MDRSHVYVQASYMKSMSNCNLKTDNESTSFQKQLIKKQMQQSKRKNLYKQISENRCTKMRIGMYTKQVGNCLDNLVLAKQVPQFMKTLSKRNSEKESHFSKSKPGRPQNILQSISQTRQRRPYKISQSKVSKTHVNGTVTIELKP
jgi:hypothetical protein